MQVSEQLKNLQFDRLDMDDLIEHSVQARHLIAERENHSLSQPEWLTDVMASLTREIKLKSRDELEKRRKELMAQQSGLETLTEKRERINRELATLDAKLGVGEKQPA